MYPFEIKRSNTQTAAAKPVEAQSPQEPSPASNSSLEDSESGGTGNLGEDSYKVFRSEGFVHGAEEVLARIEVSTEDTTPPNP